MTEPEVPSLLPAPIERTFHGLVGTGAAMQALNERISRYGPTDAPVLVTGETGTGKELVARALHLRSARRARPFVALNCSALNEELFESELFGHERGAFTGAIGIHRGRFERADGGTLFLDEIGDMPLRVQAKLLRVLEDGTFERVGGEKEISGDARIVAATNAPLERAVVERALAELAGLRQYPSAANFICVRIEGAPGRGTAVFESMKRQKVLVKNFSGGHPMLDNCLRLTIGSPPENRAMLAALAVALSDA